MNKKQVNRGLHLSVPKHIAVARKRFGWTQADLAVKAGLHVVEISHYECGRRLPSLTNIVLLAKALKVPVDWLLR